MRWSSKSGGAHHARPWRFRLFLLFIAVLAFAHLRCGENPLQPQPRGPNEVWIVSSGFDPSSLTVAVGTTVTWINKDNVTHSVDSGLPNNPDTKFPRSPNLKPGASYSNPFNQKGSFDYYCSLHGSNHGTGRIIVQ